MKKMILLMMVLIGIGYSQGMTKQDVTNWIGRAQGSPDSIAISLDKVMAFTCKTKWRNDMVLDRPESGQVFTSHIGPDFSKVTVMINKEKGIGYMWDETENMTSFYKLENVVITFLEEGTLIQAIGTSNVMNSYTVTINDYTDVMIFTGMMSHIVVRQMYDIK